MRASDAACWAAGSREFRATGPSVLVPRYSGWLTTVSGAGRAHFFRRLSPITLLNSETRIMVRRPTFTRAIFPWDSHQRTVQCETPPQSSPNLGIETKFFNGVPRFQCNSKQLQAAACARWW